MVINYILMAILILAAVFLVVAVLLQKSKEEGLSSTIAGGMSETFYSKDKGARTDLLLRKWTIIIGIVFVVAVLAVYIIQPDFSQTLKADAWKDMSGYGDIFN